METQCRNMTITEGNELLKLLNCFEVLLNGILGTCKTDPVEF